jgi:hypothetical protein
VLGSTHLNFFDIIVSNGVVDAFRLSAIIFLTISLSETMPIGLESLTTTRKLMSFSFRMTAAFFAVFCHSMIMTFFA